MRSRAIEVGFSKHRAARHAMTVLSRKAGRNAAIAESRGITPVDGEGGHGLARPGAPSPSLPATTAAAEGKEGEEDEDAAALLATYAPEVMRAQYLAQAEHDPDLGKRCIEALLAREHFPLFPGSSTERNNYLQALGSLVLAGYVSLVSMEHYGMNDCLVKYATPGGGAEPGLACWVLSAGCLRVKADGDRGPQYVDQCVQIVQRYRLILAAHSETAGPAGGEINPEVAHVMCTTWIALINASSGADLDKLLSKGCMAQCLPALMLYVRRKGILEKALSALTLILSRADMFGLLGTIELPMDVCLRAFEHCLSATADQVESVLALALESMRMLLLVYPGFATHFRVNASDAFLRRMCQMMRSQAWEVMSEAVAVTQLAVHLAVWDLDFTFLSRLIAGGCVAYLGAVLSGTNPDGAPKELALEIVRRAVQHGDRRIVSMHIQQALGGIGVFVHIVDAKESTDVMRTRAMGILQGLKEGEEAAAAAASAAGANVH